MSILEEALIFAKKIQETQQYLNLKKAKEINDSDENLQNLVNEFNMLKLKFEHNLNKKETDEGDGKKLTELYDKIMENENMVAFNEASDEMNALMNKINKILVAAVNGKNVDEFEDSDFEDEAGCAGNCHNCSGCF